MFGSTPNLSAQIALLGISEYWQEVLFVVDTQTDTNIIQAGETQRGSGMDIALFSPPMDSGVVQRQTPRKKSLFLPSAFREPRGGKQKEKKKRGEKPNKRTYFPPVQVKE